MSGEFQLNNIPVLSGNGVITVKSTDINGNTTTSYIPYFTSPNLLAKGLDNYSLEIGAIRYKLGTKSFDYNQFVIVTSYAKGLTNWLTLNNHNEILEKQQTFGITPTFIVLNGEMNLSGAISYKPVGKYGLLSEISYLYSDIFNFGFDFTTSNKYFTDASMLNSTTLPFIYVLNNFISYEFAYKTI